VTILLSSLSRAKELAKRAVCSSQLHTLGLAGQMFASEQDGLFPRTGGSATQGHQTRPTTIPDNYDDAGKTWTLHNIPTGEFGTDSRLGVAAWQGHGTSISAYMKLGMSDPRNGGFDCPSSEFRPDDRVEGVAVPAYSTEDADVSGRIIAADRVEDHQGLDSDGLYGIWNIYSNHDPRGVEDGRPTYQNIVYGDGHVAGIGQEVYKLPIGEQYADWSHRSGGGNPDGASGRWKYHWWGQAPD